jgi:hypothetical protein
LSPSGVRVNESNIKNALTYIPDSNKILINTLDNSLAGVYNL